MTPTPAPKRTRPASARRAASFAETPARAGGVYEDFMFNPLLSFIEEPSRTTQNAALPHEEGRHGAVMSGRLITLDAVRPAMSG